MTPMTEAKALTTITKANTGAVPFRRSLANGQTLTGLPPGSKFSPGVMAMAIPVKEVLNCSTGTFTSPFAGSFIYASFLVIFVSTTKWFIFQWITQGIGKVSILLGSTR
jgi:hypothetical protein